ncbi:MAG: hypothetical protein WC528_01635 [Patescibacteria group bacterium]
METSKIESFAQAMARAETLEREGGLTDEVMAIRMWVKEKYPTEFAGYLKNKTDKAGSAGETIHSNVYGKKRMDDLKNKREIKF